MGTLIRDVRFGLRQLRRRPGFTAAAVLTLGLGIGAVTALFSVVHGVLLRDLPFEEPERLVRIFTTDRAGGELTSISPPNFVSLREQSHTLAEVALYAGITQSLTGAGEPQELAAVEASTGLFDVLGVEPALGRAFVADDVHPGGEPVVVLGYGLWQRMFGASSDVLNRVVTVQGVSRTVVGVMPERFDFPGGRELWIPIERNERFAADHADNRRSRWHNAVARLRPGVRHEEVEAELRTIAAQLENSFPEENAGVRFTAVPLHDQMVDGVRRPLLVLFGAVVMVLLIACANVAGLILARSTSRQDEIAVRAALGAGRRRLVRQLLSESVLLALLGGALGVLIAWWAIDALVAARPAGLPRLDDIGLDRPVLAFSLGVTVLAGVLSGLAPAIRGTRVSLAGALRSGSRGGAASRRTARARGALVVVELAISVVLLAGAGLLLRSVAAMMSEDSGFSTTQVLSFTTRLPEAAYPSDASVLGFYDRLGQRVARLSDVQTVAAVDRLPILQNVFEYRVEVEGLAPAAPGEERDIRSRAITPEYFRALGVSLLRGRVFTEQDQGEVPVAIINEAAAERYFPGENPVGMQLRSPVNPRVGGEVVGVVANARQNALHEIPQPEMYIPHAQFPRGYMTVVVRTAGDPLAVAGAIRREIHALDPNLPLSAMRTMEQVLAESIAQPRFLATLLSLFAGCALLLAVIGIFGLLSFSVAQQAREIGIRMALGARQREVVGAVVRRGLVLVVAGLGVGVAAALPLTRTLESLLYGVVPIDGATFAAVVILLVSAALLAIYLPARRAARVDPMVALRAE